MSHKKFVYDFEEGSAKMRMLLGGKGAGLAEMTRLGIPVPPGFTITTEACIEFYRLGKKMPDGLREEVENHLKKLEEKTGKKLGDPNNPLLVSVRSGAPVSMPGMMDTILNVGLNDEAVKGLAKLTNNERFAYDSYRRLIQMFGSIVMGIPKEKFDEAFEEVKKEYGAKTDAEIPAEGMKKIVEKFKEVYKRETGEDFPQDPKEQLWRAIMAVFESWNNPRAIKYREIHKIPDDWGTAVNVVMMVFGNMGWDSATGVAFTRDPSTGEKRFYGEYLPNAQGEDVVAGIRTPKPIEELKNELPEVYKQLVEVARKLEQHYKDMQDIEFTVERGKLWLLQTRTGKRTAKAAIKIAVDMAKEGIITKDEAIMRIKPEILEGILHRQVDPKARENNTPIAKGLAASPGAAVGEVVFSSEEAERLVKENNKKVILVRPETTPDDIGGMNAAEGILTARGGMTSHAAVVARAMGKPAVVGAEMIKIDLEKEIFTVNNVTVKKGDIITVDGTTGEVYLGALPTIAPGLTDEAKELLSWCDEFRKLGVRANAERPEDIKRALEFGAEGIGLARTENMFVRGGRADIVFEIMLAETEEERRKALEKLIPLQKKDFRSILELMDNKPVIVRLLDVQFYALVFDPEQMVEEYYKKKISGEASEEELTRMWNLIQKVRAVKDSDPQMGFRACRLGIVYPEVYEAQIRAALEALVELKKEGKNPILEIMMPGIAVESELKYLNEIARKVIKEVSEKYNMELDVKLGTMIESPRAAFLAGNFAKISEFFSFGTNDLTQFMHGWSRDDAERAFIPAYIEKGILEYNPFKTIDKDGVGGIMKYAVEHARKANPNIEIGICGEHGGDPRSIEICHKIGLDYVSASAWRIPTARLAAAQAAIKEKWEKEGRTIEKSKY
ncbi:MAG: pyruvate, phosphate dikinase [Candidatus Njordarchaeia archaeon]